MSALPALKPKKCPYPQCGHEWYPRPGSRSKGKPSICPECKRPLNLTMTVKTK